VLRQLSLKKSRDKKIAPLRQLPHKKSRDKKNRATAPEKIARLRQFSLSPNSFPEYWTKHPLSSCRLVFFFLYDQWVLS